jgi:hypothetical protein
MNHFFFRFMRLFLQILLRSFPFLDFFLYKNRPTFSEIYCVRRLRVSYSTDCQVLDWPCWRHCWVRTSYLWGRCRAIVCKGVVLDGASQPCSFRHPKLQRDIRFPCRRYGPTTLWAHLGVGGGDQAVPGILVFCREWWACCKYNFRSKSGVYTQIVNPLIRWWYFIVRERSVGRK